MENSEFIKGDDKLATPKADARKSLRSRQEWGRNYSTFMRGIKKYHKSLEGRRAHRKLGRYLATKNVLPKSGVSDYVLHLKKELHKSTQMRERVELRDNFDLSKRVEVKFNVDEDFVGKDNAPIVDGKHILARVSGPFFLVNDVSRNNRFYSRRLWENALGKLKPVLENGGTIGTVSHDQPIDDKAVLEGKISHIVTRVWIDDSNPSQPVGMGEALILGTPPGQVLNSLFRAGYKVPVSSRALGSYKGKGSHGEDIIDEDSFEPITWDFVLSPGVLNAVPGLVESFEKQAATAAIKEGKKMEPTLERLTEERIALQGDLHEAIKESNDLKARVRKLEEDAADKAKVIEAYTKVVGSVDQAKAIDEGLRKFLELEPLKGFAQEMGLMDLVGGQSGVNKLLGLTETYFKLGSPSELKAIKEAHAAYESKCSVDEVEKLASIVEQYMANGTPAQVAKLKSAFSAYKKLGSPKDIKEVFDIAKQYIGLGHPEQIRKAQEQAKKDEAKRQADQKLAVARKIAESFDTPVKVVAEMLKSMQAEKVINVLSQLRETSEVSRQYKVPKTASPAVRSKLPSPSKGRTIAESIFESMNPREPYREVRDPRMEA